MNNNHYLLSTILSYADIRIMHQELYNKFIQIIYLMLDNPKYEFIK